jgi:hypothetical protein
MHATKRYTAQVHFGSTPCAYDAIISQPINSQLTIVIVVIVGL